LQTPAPETTADATGHFVLEVPKGGSWRLSATARGYRTQSFDAHETYYAAVVLTDAQPVADVRFALVPSSVVAGYVLDEAGEPVQMAQVSAERLERPAPNEVRQTPVARPAGLGFTDDRGRYEISGLEPGTYRIRVQARPWYARTTSGVPSPGGDTPQDPSLDVTFPVTWFPASDDPETAETIRLQGGEEREANVRLAAIPSVRLRVPRSEAGAALAGDPRRPVQGRGATITRVSGDGTAGAFGGEFQAGATATVGSDWEFGGLSPGRYEVRIPQPGQEDLVRMVEVRAGSAPILSLGDDGNLVKVTVSADANPRGEVVFTDAGTGMRYSTNGGQGGRGGFRRRDSEGDGVAGDAAAATRSVMLPPGQYEISLGNSGSDYLLGISATGATAEGRLVTISQAATVALHLGSRRVQVDGTVRRGGKPVEGAMVLLVPSTLGSRGDLRAVLREESATDGSFSLLNVIPGQYILVALDGGWNVDWRDTATLSKYLLHGVPVDLAAAGTTTARVREELEAQEP
jgi:hypothetical protein